MTLPAVGPWVWAHGSQVWTATEGSFVPKAAKKPSISHMRTDLGRIARQPRHHAGTSPAPAGHASDR